MLRIAGHGAALFFFPCHSPCDRIKLESAKKIVHTLLIFFVAHRYIHRKGKKNMKKLELKEFLNYRMLSSLKLSPDGKKAAFVVKQAGKELKSYKSNIWLYENRALRQLTAMDSEAFFLWEDDEHLLFTSSRKSEEAEETTVTSLYRISIYGGEGTFAFGLPVAAMNLQPLGTHQYVMTAPIDAECPDFYQMTKEEQEAYRKSKEEEDYQIVDELPFIENGNGFVNKRRIALFVYDTETGETKRVTDPYFKVGACLVLGDKVIYSGSGYRDKWCPRGGIHVWNPETNETRELLPEDEYRFYFLQPWGEKVLIKALKKGTPRSMSKDGAFYTVDPKTGEMTQIAEQELSVGGSVSSDCRLGGGYVMRQLGEDLYYIVTKGGDTVLYRMTKTGEMTEMFGYPGTIDCFEMESEKTALAVCMYDNRLQELYRLNLETRQAERLTSLNEEVLKDTYIADYEPLSIQSQGAQIDGFVLKPKDFDENQKYPAILEIHGGPKVAYGPVFFHEMQVMANEGYFVFFCNPIGSDGKGYQFADIYGHCGEPDYENIMDFTDAVLKKYPQIDEKRLGVTGGSYGGFMTNWIIGHNNRFAAAASQRSVSNRITTYGIADIGYYCNWERQEANMYDDVEKIWAGSPLKYANNATTPTLFVHSSQDFRCSLAEGLQMFTAIKDQGVPARMCIFKGENHELSRSGQPKHRVRRLEEIMKWMDQYLKPEKEN